MTKTITIRNDDGTTRQFESSDFHTFEEFRAYALDEVVCFYGPEFYDLSGEGQWYYLRKIAQAVGIVEPDFRRKATWRWLWMMVERLNLDMFEIDVALSGYDMGIERFVMEVHSLSKVED